jgi:ribosomal protein S18 acetylase RimI-like enzyme
MTGEILIREARSAELELIETLVKTAYQEFQPLFPEKVWLAWMDNISAVVHGESGILLVAADPKGNIRGVVKFYPHAGQAAMGVWPPGAASMRILAVHPQSRGKGYGLLLVEECLSRAREMNLPALYLYTGAFMAAARHIYEKLGFTRAPEFDKDPGPIAYRLDL